MFNDEKKNKSQQKCHGDLKKNNKNSFSDLKGKNQNNCPCDDCDCSSKDNKNDSLKNNCHSCGEEDNISNENASMNNDNCPCDDCDCELKDDLEDTNCIEKLKTKIMELKKDLTNLNTLLKNEKLKYQADLDNFTKRVKKERINERKYASLNIIENLLVPYEQFEKVVEMPVKDELLKKFLDGFKMIQQQIKNIFIQEGVKEIKSLGEIFDPRYHYAMEKVFDKKQPDNTNIDVLQKGYLYKDRVLKPAMVKVNEWSEKNGEDK